MTEPRDTTGSIQANENTVAVVELAATCACPSCRDGYECSWRNQRCAHRRDRSCDSRCNDDSAHPWYRQVDGVLEVSHAWCLPRQVGANGWKRGRDEVTGDDLDPDRACACCGGLMSRWPR